MAENVERKGDYCETYTGKRFYPFDPRAEDVCIEDIAHALSMQCRFGGHCARFYSVAQHSVFVSKMADTLLHVNPKRFYEVAMWGLFHDAAEAYFVDVPRPIKQSIPEYAAIEERIMAVIIQAFGLTPGRPVTVDVFDEVALATEARDLMPSSGAHWKLRFPPHSDFIQPVLMQAARDQFMFRFDFLKGHAPKS